MEIVIHRKDNRFVFQLDGSLDIYTSLDLKSSLEENIKESNVDVCIDLDKLNYIDSSGIGILIKSLNYIQSLNGNMCVANLKPSIEKIFKVSGLTTYFEIINRDEFESRYRDVMKK
ncbi:MAG: STAS domain-containing protein [Leptospiraceae bacterium]|nr:STAS domain-containing protein [Leptospiraceae bacterium]MDW7976198.1 STAS domain-containing protein [Leptospiraceae bacterium]